MTTTRQAAQISHPGGEWEVVERAIPEPDAGQVRVKVEACGMCHSDVFVKEGHWPGLQYPRVPGHAIAGHIDAVGDHVRGWRPGQRVGVGWHGGHCCVCAPCQRGDFAMCVQRKVTGVDVDGGYAAYMLAPVTAVAAIPDDIPAEEAGSAISPCSTRGRWALRRSRSTGATIKRRWRGNWARIITSMRARTMR